MSAYVVSDETILVIARGLIDYRVDCPFVKFNDYETVFVNERIRPIAQALLEQNYRSVNERYDTDDEAPAINARLIEYDDGELYGCIRCYIYQACETDDFEDSTIYRALLTLKDHMLEKLIKQKAQEITWGK